MLETVVVEKAVGMVIPHDITEIVKNVKKGVAFKKGHIICKEDIEHLKRLGKDHIYVLSLDDDEIHENEAASMLVASLAGSGLKYSEEPAEGKIAIEAEHDGLLRINKEALLQFNMLGEVMCSTLHDNTPVKEGEVIAAVRLIPLISSRELVEKATNIAVDSKPVLQVVLFRKPKLGS